MKELSTEIINIDGVDYTLFLNRKGIVAWEKFTKSEKQKLQTLQDKYKGLNTEKDFNELDDNINPFDGLEDIDEIDNDIEFMNKIFARLYWIMLYTNHKLSISDASKLYDKACEEYGNEQVILLAQQMVNEINTDPSPNKQLKNLAALKPTKN